MDSYDVNDWINVETNVFSKLCDKYEHDKSFKLSKTDWVKMIFF